MSQQDCAKTKHPTVTSRYTYKKENIEHKHRTHTCACSSGRAFSSTPSRSKEGVG